MNRETFDKLVEDTIKETADLLVRKGAEYAHDSDRLANFKKNAEKNGRTPLEEWKTYWGKHVDSVDSYVARVRNEAIRIVLVNRIRNVELELSRGNQIDSDLDFWADPVSFMHGVNGAVPESLKIIDSQLSEPIEGRLNDLINYAILGKAILKELREG